MWLTSKMPTRCRTARCSSAMPEYCRGIAQPAKSTIRAPRATWRSYRAVRLRSVDGGGIGWRSRTLPFPAVRRTPTRYYWPGSRSRPRDRRRAAVAGPGRQVFPLLLWPPRRRRGTPEFEIGPERVVADVEHFAGASLVAIAPCEHLTHVTAGPRAQ